MQQTSSASYRSNVITQVLNAGYCVSEAIPQLSRCLVSQADWLVESQNLNLPSSKGPDRTFCLRCKTIWIPGWNLNVSVSINKVVLKGKKQRERTLQYACRSCGHICNIPIPRPPPSAAQSHSAIIEKSGASEKEKSKKRENSDLSSTRNNAASKKRAKLRKKDSSLENLISKNKRLKSESSSSKFGLDLSDLMRGP